MQSEVCGRPLRNARPDYDDLYPSLVEVKGTLNSRPAASICIFNDVEEPLTSFHLIYERGTVFTRSYAKQKGFIKPSSVMQRWPNKK